MEEIYVVDHGLIILLLDCKIDLITVNDSVNWNAFYIVPSPKKTVFLLMYEGPPREVSFTKVRRRFYFQTASSLNSCQQRNHADFFQNPK